LRFILPKTDIASEQPKKSKQVKPLVLSGLQAFQEYGSALSGIVGTSVLCVGPCDPKVVTLLEDAGYEVKVSESLESIPKASYDTVLCVHVPTKESQVQSIAKHAVVVLTETQVSLPDPFKLVHRLPKAKLYVSREELKPMSRVPFLKTVNEFYSLDPIEKWAEQYLKDGVAVEEVPSGLRAFIHKSGDSVRVTFEDQGRDRTSSLPSLADATKTLSVDEVVLDCFVQLRKGKWPVARKSMSSLVVSEDVRDAGSVHAVCTDILWHEGRCVHTLPQVERRTLLKKLGLESPLYLVQSRTVHSLDALKSALAQASTVKGSAGARLKSVRSEYVLSGRTEEWATLSPTVEIKAEVLDKTRIGQAWSYVMGYARNGSTVKIGKAFNTTLDVPVGSVLSVSVEEIRERKDGSLTWALPRVLSYEHYRQRPDTERKVIQVAERAGIFQKAARPTKQVQSRAS